MQQIGIYEARNSFSKIVQKVQEGEEFVITNRGKEIALITAPDSQRHKKLKKSLDTLRDVFKNQPPGTLDDMIGWAKEGQR